MTSPALRRAALVAALALTLGACGSEEPSESGASESSASITAPVESGAPPADGAPFGPGCAELAAEGAGDLPVATAAGSIPGLSSLVQALTMADLVASLDAREAVTVLAPANPAFAAVPAEDLQALMGDSARLTAVLTHHVIAGRLTPEQLAGTHTTLNNDEVTVDGGPDSFTISGEGTLTGTVATVVCADVQTANATVYVIDQVLAPVS